MSSSHLKTAHAIGVNAALNRLGYSGVGALYKEADALGLGERASQLLGSLGEGSRGVSALRAVPGAVGGAIGGGALGYGMSDDHPVAGTIAGALGGAALGGAGHHMYNAIENAAVNNALRAGLETPMVYSALPHMTEREFQAAAPGMLGKIPPASENLLRMPRTSEDLLRNTLLR